MLYVYELSINRHCPHEEDAEGFVNAISNWINELTGTLESSVSGVEGSTREIVR